MGDFVKGRLESLLLESSVVEGIRLHRQVDSYTDGHPVVALSRQRLSDRRLVSGIMVDMVYDHFLTVHWSDFTHESLHEFCATRYQRLLAQLERLPARLQFIVPRMAEQDWLGSYRDLDTIAYALERIGQRLRQPELLANTLAELERNYEQLELDFLAFFPELAAHYGRFDRRLPG